MRILVRYMTANGKVESRRLRPGIAIDLFDRLERVHGKVLSIEAPDGVNWTVAQARRNFEEAVRGDSGGH